MENNPDLVRNLISNFHMEWDEDYDTWQDLVDDYVAADRYIAERTLAALRLFLANHNEKGLRDACATVPWDFATMSGSSYTAWFEMLLKRIEQQLRPQSG